MSLVGFSTVEEVARYAKQFPTMQFELSYKMDHSFLDAVSPFLTERVASVHACCPSRTVFPNFGSFDPQVLKESFEGVEESLKTAQAFGADILVLHPGYACDWSIPADNAKRSQLLNNPVFSPYIQITDGAICTKDYPSQPVYLRHLRQAFDQLAEVAELANSYHVRLAVENLNPRVGYLFQTPEEMAELARLSPSLHLCLDVGHLWIASSVYGFSYFDALQGIVNTGKVVNCHLHSNSTDASVQRYRDDHHSFEKYDFPSQRILEIIGQSEANFVLETIEEPELNTVTLNHMVSSTVQEEGRIENPGTTTCRQARFG
jgi:sugar phosphate isomerase/epimerase